MKRRLSQVGAFLLAGALVCSIVFAEKHCNKEKGLPAQLKEALTAKYPGASIDEVKMDEEEFKVFEVELVLKDGQEIEVTLACDGTVMEVDNEISVANLPFDVSAVIPQNAEVKEVDSEVTYTVLAPVALAQPKTTYELVVIIDGKETEFKLASDGTVLCKKADKNDDDEDDGDDDGDDDDDDDDDDDEDNDDEGEKVVSINEVPAPVKATILEEINGGVIEEIEIENENGQTVYDADVVIDGQKIEIKVAEDGKLLSKNVDDDDD